jgi:hypothetical protein
VVFHKGAKVGVADGSGASGSEGSSWEKSNMVILAFDLTIMQKFSVRHRDRQRGPFRPSISDINKVLVQNRLHPDPRRVIF